MNWFENHPARSIITYTLLVAGTTWAISYFIIDENKVNFYRSQVEYEKSISQQYKAKTEILQSEIVSLGKEKDQYLRWLQETPGTIPFFEQRILELELQNTELKESININVDGNDDPFVQMPNGIYSYVLELSKNSAFIDPKTGLILSVVSINVDFEAEVNLTLPGEETKKLTEVTAGMQWEFIYKETNYRVIITKINWYNNTYEVLVTQEDE